MWARAMRAPGRRHTLIPAPQTVTVALLKPGAPRGRLREHLAEHYREVSVAEQVLSVQQCELLYPDAYGADFVAERTAYLTSGTVLVVVLRAAGDDAAVRGCELKSRLRRELGADRLRNHLHMPDNSAEVWADIAVLAGETAAVEVYGRWESDAQRADARVAAYRAALEFPG
jgi:hypothetical protein